MKRAGYPPVWSLLVMVPAAGPLALIVKLAFSDWPIQKKDIPMH